MTIAKAITAVIVTFLALVLGEDVATNLDVGVIEAIVVSLLSGGFVYAVPNHGPVTTR